MLYIGLVELLYYSRKQCCQALAISLAAAAAMLTVRAIVVGCLGDTALLELLETRSDAILAQEPTIIAELSSRTEALEAKLAPRWGSTVGDAIARAAELAAGASLASSAALAIGCVKELELARALGVCSSATVGRVVRLLKAYKLPTRLPAALIGGDAAERVASQILSLDVVLLRDLGEHTAAAAATTEVDRSLLLRVLDVAAMTIPTSSSSPLTVKPICGSILVPGSKSISNRVLIMAALADGVCRVRGMLWSEDTQVMLTALQHLGAGFGWEDGGATLVVNGTAGTLRAPSADLYLANAGTASRFLTTVCTLLPPGAAATVTGNSRAKERPIGPLVDALRAHGCAIGEQGEAGRLPLRVDGSGGLAGGEFALSGKVSSQYVSSVLLSAPYARETLALRLKEAKPTSLPYIRMTVELMRRFGVDVDVVADDHYVIPPGPYKPPASGVFDVEPDASSATYALAMAAVTGGEVTVEGVGSTSVQGDAGFCLALRSMGCTVVQTETSSTVRGPPPCPAYAPTDAPRLRGVDIDMETMTDAFLTLCAVAAVAEGVTQISGISNQRVKECNRIAAIVREFAKCGILAWELEDGIAVQGIGGTCRMTAAGARCPRDYATGEAVARVHCYDDHRVAMCHAVLGCILHGVLVLDKECTEKTYPEFWDHCETLGIALVPGTLATSSSPPSPLAAHFPAAHSSTPQAFPVDRESAAAEASIVLVGMRCSGKSHLARTAASVLGWRCIDLDDELVRAAGATCAEVIATRGWDGFRALELEVLQAALIAFPFRAVISCGGGIVETEAARACLATYISAAHGGARVVRLHRALVDVDAELNGPSEAGGEGSAERPKYSGNVSVRDVFERRQPWFVAVSTHDFVMRPGETDWEQVNCEFGVFCRRITKGALRNASALPKAPRFVLSVSGAGPDPSAAMSAADLTGVDAVEIRVDECDSCSPIAVLRTLAAFRRAVDTAHFDLPIIFTARSSRQGGAFAGAAPGDGDDAVAFEERLFAFARLALRSGCEFVDVECCWAGRARNAFLALMRRRQCYHTHAIGTVVAASSSSGAALDALFAQGACVAAPDAAIEAGDSADLSSWGAQTCAARVVAPAAADGDAEAMLRAVASAQAALAPLEISGYCSGERGTLSRQLSPALAPVELSGALAPSSIQSARESEGKLHPCRFHLFGSPIGASPSPLMHNSGFKALSLPHVYSLVDTFDIDDCVAAIRKADFGGASVTIPHKESIIPHLDTLSPAARAIGAVNTVIVVANKEDGTKELHGDNTDYLGIFNPLAKALGPQYPLRAGASPNLCALVVGAGGTARAACYCVQRLGLKLHVWNRTYEKAATLALEFGGTALRDAGELDAVKELQCVISTVPAAAGWTLPPALLEQRPAVVEVVYKPRVTALVTQARGAGCEVVQGIDMLIAQGVEQFERWTRRRAPPAMEVNVRAMPE